MVSATRRYAARYVEGILGFRIFDRQYGVWMRGQYGTIEEAREHIDALLDAQAQQADVAAREADRVAREERHYHDD